MMMILWLGIGLALISTVVFFCLNNNFGDAEEVSEESRNDFHEHFGYEWVDLEDDDEIADEDVEKFMALVSERVDTRRS